MNIELFKTIYNALEAAGLEPRSYSGRAMFGDRCLSIVVSHPWDAMVAVVEAVEGLQGYRVAELLRKMGRSRTDDMGRNLVVYWPDLEWPEDVDEA